MNYCKIENGVVVDRALFDTEMPSDWPGRSSWIADDAAQIGWQLKGGVFQPPAVAAASLEERWEALRLERNRRLTASDWTQVSDAPVDQVAWAAYRQALRDLPATVSDPASFSWPTAPAENGGIT